MKPATEKGILSSDESLYFSFRKCIFSKLTQYFAHIYCYPVSKLSGVRWQLDEKGRKTAVVYIIMMVSSYGHSHHKLGKLLGRLRKGVFERPRQHAESGLFTFLSSGFANILSCIVSTSVKKLGNTNFIASRCIFKKEKSPHFRLTCVSQKRLCLSSVLCHILPGTQWSLVPWIALTSAVILSCTMHFNSLRL